MQKKSDEGDDMIIEAADTAQVDIAPEGTPENQESIPMPQESTAEAPTDSVEPKPTSSPDTFAQDNTPVTFSDEMADYSVQKGDTLMKIAFETYGDIFKWKELYDWNKDKLSKASRLEVGMHLKYKKPVTSPSLSKNGDPYLIKKGDTLGSIAYEIYAKRSKWKKLFSNNKGLIKNPNRIYAGFYLYYQMTAQEKLDVERIKGHSVPQNVPMNNQLGDSGFNTEPPVATAPTDSAPTTEATPFIPTPEENSAPSAAGDDGLSSLAAPKKSNRAPASKK